ncbi:protein Flattop [Chanos chanos]|uniref:Protein Flattop n=1 Tax=Chanos chanos TaxID=29144 RepID=A0A6J2UU73_CHACN|nr:protein Flattop [Chanos chanos]
MSSNYSANQYENTFKSHKLQNWTVPRHFKERPEAAEGHTVFIATDHGHLLPGKKSKYGTAWPSFKGTWDLPARILPTYINPTVRSLDGQQRLRSWGQQRQQSRPRTRESEAELEVQGDANEQNSISDQPTEEHPMPATTPSQNIQEPAKEGPESQNSHTDSRPVSEHSQAQSRPASQHSRAQSRPASQHSQAQSRPASQHSRAQSRSASQAQLRPASQHSQGQERAVSQHSQAPSHPSPAPEKLES